MHNINKYGVLPGLLYENITIPFLGYPSYDVLPKLKGTMNIINHTALPPFFIVKFHQLRPQCLRMTVVAQRAVNL